jgi:HAE1 family hydrophobic/amphiphilic exporter-1
MGELDRRFRARPGVLETYTVIGETSGRVAKGQGDVTKGSIYVRLTDLPERPFTPFVYLGDPESGIGKILNNAARAIGFGRLAYSQFDVMSLAREVLEDYPDLRAAVQDVSAFQGSGFRQVEIDFNLSGPDMDKLKEYSDQIAAWMKEQGYFVDVDTSLS